MHLKSDEFLESDRVRGEGRTMSARAVAVTRPAPTTIARLAFLRIWLAKTRLDALRDRLNRQLTGNWA